MSVKAEENKFDESFQNLALNMSFIIEQLNKSNIDINQSSPLKVKNKFSSKVKQDLSKSEWILPAELKDQACSTTRKPDIVILGVGKRGPLDKKLQFELVNWIKKNQPYMTLSSKQVCEKAMQLFLPKYPNFKGSLGWYNNFVRRHNLKRFRSRLL